MIKVNENVEVRQIVGLKNHEWIKILNWMYEWWGKEEGYSIEEVACYLKHGMNKNHFPYMFGLYKNDCLIGMYQLTYSDLDIRPDLYPWVANVYIDSKYRGRGYGRVLLTSIQDNMKIYHIHELYLYTYHQNLYEKFGFEYLEDIDTFSKIPRIQRIYHIKL